MNPKKLWTMLLAAGMKWADDRGGRMGAALAYYTIFSLAPLLVIAIAVAGMVFGSDAAQGKIVGQLQDLVGEEAGKAIQAMLANASHPGSGIIATVIGVVVMIVGAMGVFNELHDDLNTIWQVQPKPGQTLWRIARDQLLSFVMVLFIALLLLTALVASTAVSTTEGFLNERVGLHIGAAGRAVNYVLTLGVMTLLFAMIYRILPDVEIPWGDVWLGAVVTALLFSFGKYLIGLYLSYSTINAAYGAAGSLVVLLAWTYYSAQIFLFGAQLTQVYATRYGSKMRSIQQGSGPCPPNSMHPV
jgi:membrane protein